MGYRSVRRGIGALVAVTVALTAAIVGVAVPAQAADSASNWVAVDVSGDARNASDQNVAVADDGSLITTWSSFDGSTKTIQASVSRDDGMTWSAPASLSAPGVDAFRSQIAISPTDGRLVVVWGTWDGFYDTLQAATSTDGGVTWSAPTDIPSVDADTPQIGVTADGDFIVSWTSVSAASQIHASTSTDGGASWTQPVSLSEPGQGAARAQIAITSTGATVIWDRSNGFRRVVQSSTSTDGGTTWTTPIDISSATVYATSPMVAVHNSGVLTTTWEGNDGSRVFAQASTSHDGGATWTSPVTLSEEGRSSYRPQIAASNDGTVAVVWFGRSIGRDIVSVSTWDVESQTWSAPLALSETSRDASSPRIAASDDGRFTVAWRDRSGLQNGVIRAATTIDGGATWTTPVDLVSDAHRESTPQLAASRDGRVSVTWYASNGINDILRAVTFPTAVADVTVRTAWIDAAPGDQSSVSVNNWHIGTSWFSGASDDAVQDIGTRLAYVDSSIAISQFMATSNVAAYDSSLTCEGEVDVIDGTFTVPASNVVCTFTNTLIPAFFETGTPEVWPTSPKVDDTLEAMIGAWVPQPASVTYQWLRNGVEVPGATEPTYKVLASDLGARFSVVVTGVAERFATASATSAPTAAVANGPIATTRLSGADRYATAVSISREFESARQVYIATGEGYADALSAGPAAAHFNAPLLLTPRKSLPAIVRAELQRLHPEKIVIVGGIGAVSAAVEDAIRQLPFGAEVQRIAGVDRYDTSRRLAATTWAPDELGTAYLATGADFPDALSATPAAAHFGGPVLLVPGKSPVVDASSIALLRSLGVDEIKIAGGTGVVSAGIESQMRVLFGADNVTRNGGGDRYGTSVAINRDAFGAAQTVYLATATGYADALAGAALAGTKDMPLFISQRECIPRDVMASIQALGSTRVVLLGGDGVLTWRVANLTTCQ